MHPAFTQVLGIQNSGCSAWEVMVLMLCSKPFTHWAISSAPGFCFLLWKKQANKHKNYCLKSFSPQNNFEIRWLLHLSQMFIRCLLLGKPVSFHKMGYLLFKRCLRASEMTQGVKESTEQTWWPGFYPWSYNRRIQKVILCLPHKHHTPGAPMTPTPTQINVLGGGK